MCSNCEARYGFDNGYGCSNNSSDAADRYVELKKKINEIASRPQTELKTQFALREALATVDGGHWGE